MTTKKQAIKELERTNLSNQNALVKKIEGVRSSKNIKRYIPGGKHLSEQVSKERLPGAINQWLRHTRHFTEMEFSFLDPKPAALNESKVYDFDTSAANFEWERRGRKWLSEILAEYMLQDKVVSVKVKKEGVYIYSTDTSFNSETEEWKPYVNFVSPRRS